MNRQTSSRLVQRDGSPSRSKPALRSEDHLTTANSESFGFTANSNASLSLMSPVGEFDSTTRSTFTHRSDSLNFDGTPTLQSRDTSFLQSGANTTGRQTDRGHKKALSESATVDLAATVNNNTGVFESESAQPLPKKSQVAHYQQQQRRPVSSKRSVSASLVASAGPVNLENARSSHSTRNRSSTTANPVPSGSTSSRQGEGHMRAESLESWSDSQHSGGLDGSVVLGGSVYDLALFPPEAAVHGNGQSASMMPLVVGGGSAVTCTTPPTNYLEPLNSVREHSRKHSGQQRSTTPTSTLALDPNASFRRFSGSTVPGTPATTLLAKPPRSTNYPHASFSEAKSKRPSQKKRPHGKEQVSSKKYPQQGISAYCRATFKEKTQLLPVFVLTLVVALLAWSTWDHVCGFSGHIASNRNAFYGDFVDAMRCQKRLNNHSHVVRVAIRNAKLKVSVEVGIREALNQELGQSKSHLIQYFALRKRRTALLDSACQHIRCGHASNDGRVLSAQLRALVPEPRDLPQPTPSPLRQSPPPHSTLPLEPRPTTTTEPSTSSNASLKGSCPSMDWESLGPLLPHQPELAHDEGSEFVLHDPEEGELETATTTTTPEEVSEVWTLEHPTAERFELQGGTGPQRPEARLSTAQGVESVPISERTQAKPKPSLVKANSRWSWWVGKIQSCIRYCIFVSLAAFWMRLN